MTAPPAILDPPSTATIAYYLKPFVTTSDKDQSRTQSDRTTPSTIFNRHSATLSHRDNCHSAKTSLPAQLIPATMPEIQRDSHGAPKAGAPSLSKQDKMMAHLRNSAAVEKGQERAKAAIWYDHQSPAVRKQRRAVQSEYEWTIKQWKQNNAMTADELWNVDTFIEFCGVYLECVAAVTEGKIGAKPKVGVLLYRKSALYWWAIRHIKEFPSLNTTWELTLTGHIAKIADMEGFEKGSQEKSTLIDADLALLFRAIFTYAKHREFLRMNYILWLLIFHCGVRPGSCTVSEGYEEGALLGDGSVVKLTEDDCLRWKHIHFMRTDTGIAVRVTFYFLKGGRHKPIQDKKTWTFMPSNSPRHEFDLALLLTATAFERGLFSEHKTLESLWNGTEQFPKVDPKINGYPVFCQSNTAGTMLYDKAMKVNHAGVKLKQVCKDLGYFGRNTLYSFRRDFLTDLRRKKDTDYAREAAGHRPGTSTIFAYDVTSQSDVDIVALRLDQSGYSREHLRKMYSDHHMRRIKSISEGDSANSATTSLTNHRLMLNKELSRRVDVKLVDDEAYLAMEADLRAMLNDLATKLDESLILARQVHKYRLALQQKGLLEELQGLEQLLRKRKTLKATIRNRLSKGVREQMLAEHKRSLKSIKKASATPSRGVPKEARDSMTTAASTAYDRLESEAEALFATVDLADSETEDDEVDADALHYDEDTGAASREEPDGWSALPEEVEFVMNVGEEDVAATDDSKLAFAKRWIHHTSEQDVELQCVLCELDDTLGQAAKQKMWKLAKLDKHLKDDFHSRKNELSRAFDIDAESSSDNKAFCPLCLKKMVKKTFNSHLESEHGDEL